MVGEMLKFSSGDSSENLLLTARCVTATTWLTASDGRLLTSEQAASGRRETEK